MRYERPCVERRERLEGLLTVAQSDVKPDGFGGSQTSDVRAKEHIVPVTWGDETVAYAKPEIADREPLTGLLDAAQSDVKPDSETISDVRAKDNIRPVAWGDETVAYAKPEIADREPLTGLLDPAQSDLPPDVLPSDVRIKRNFVPVRW